jgi:hypothetical protein
MTCGSERSPLLFEALWDFAGHGVGLPNLLGRHAKNPNKFGTPICHPRKLPETPLRLLWTLYRLIVCIFCLSASITLGERIDWRESLLPSWPY